MLPWLGPAMKLFNILRNEDLNLNDDIALHR